MQGTAGQPVTQTLDALSHLLGKCGQTLDELADDEGEDAADDRETGQQHQRDRDAARNADAIKEVDRGHQQCRHHRRQGDRHDDQLEPLDHPEHRDDRGHR